MSNSLIFVDGFDDYTNLGDRWDASANAGNFDISSSGARTGSQCLTCSNFNGNGRLVQNFTARATYIAGAAVKITGFGTGGQELMDFMDSGTV